MNAAEFGYSYSYTYLFRNFPFILFTVPKSGLACAEFVLCGDEVV